jgi:putative tricarboxylic transport membrane protein
MIDLHASIQAFHLLFGSWEPWLVVVPGMLIGLLFGALPGLSTSIAMALFLPFTLYMDFLSAIIFMTAVFTGGGFGCAIPAILINIPGMPGAVATTFDGFPMAQAGQHNEALGLGLMASSFAEALSYVILFFSVELMAWAVLKLGPPEMFVVALWGLSLIAALRERHYTRGLLAGVFGLILGTVGFSARGDIRGTMGFDVLLDGIPDVPALIGLFAASELFNMMRRDYIVEDASARKVSLRRILRGMRQTFDYPGVLLRGSLIGVIIGAVPGVGSSVSNLLAYSEARRTADDPDSYGQGNPRGVVAAESANSSSEGGSMATLLALGIPGGGATAVMLSAFAMHNVTGGPRFLSDHKDVVYAIIFANFAQVIILMVIGVGFIFASSFIVKIPVRIMVPLIMCLSVIGSYTLTGNMAGPVTFVVFALLGWVMRRYDYPVAATVVGLLLGHMAEGELLRSVQMSGLDPAFILERPIALGFLILLVLSLTWPLVSRRLKGRDALPAPANETS